MTPQRGLLLVRPVETEETNPGGLVILTPDARERMSANQCEVIAVGAFAECDPMRSGAERKCTRTHSYVDICGGCCDSKCHGSRRIHPHPIRPGDWLLVRPRSYIDGPNPELKQWFIHQDNVLAILSTETI